MRVLFDTNVFISFLLPSSDRDTITQIIDAAFKRKFALLISQEIVEEFSNAIARKKYLSKRITNEDANQFIKSIAEIAHIIPALSVRLPSTVRDIKDNYLITYAVIGNTDYLVTGDKDLLTLKKVGEVKIVTPKKFLQILKAK
ncbi:putative toxin-antitoxin system toxin component, PIN family [Candidatus Roizmanbacteria bacterium]|nr:putative toxin-antitoxin system toxin component, PIN family [Candidatus Roizmanbacteria bacterium]